MVANIDTTNYVSALNNSAPFIENRDKLKKEKSAKLKNKKEKSFLRLLNDSKIDTEEFDYDSKIDGLIGDERKKVIDDIMADLQDKVYSSGANLADAVNSQTITEYKKAVKLFVNFAVKNFLDAKFITSGGLNPMKQKNYVIVKVIDEKMERLTKELLFNQIEKLEILERIDEIKGLLVDLRT